LGDRSTDRKKTKDTNSTVVAPDGRSSQYDKKTPDTEDPVPIRAEYMNIRIILYVN